MKDESELHFLVTSADYWEPKTPEFEPYQYQLPIWQSDEDQISYEEDEDFHIACTLYGY